MASVLTPQPVLYFLQQILSYPASALPKGAQWVVAFEDLQGRILPGIALACSYEPDGKNWLVEKANSVLLHESYQSKQGCMFCQAIDLPGDGTAAVVEGNIKSNAFLRSWVGAGREDFPQMRMTFLETNVSFADNFLRGWALSTSNFGMIARAKNDSKNYRTNLICYKIGTIDPDRPPFVLMKMSFYDICCISVSNEEYNYAPATTPTMREARFIFNHYSIDTTTANNSNLFVQPQAQVPLVPNYSNPADIQARNA
ncbi:MAG: hypothetical protein KGR46_07760, partial [Verrucomicrobia bacterium]|nr:hypothetical protein [Verrucomicrobiota bacterium]